jgi:hypothetical protein
LPRSCRSGRSSFDEGVAGRASAGFFFDLTAAAASRAAVGDSATDIAAPLMFLALLRHPDRLASDVRPAAGSADNVTRHLR